MRMLSNCKLPVATFDRYRLPWTSPRRSPWAPPLARPKTSPSKRCCCSLLCREPQAVLATLIPQMPIQRLLVKPRKQRVYKMLRRQQKRQIPHLSQHLWRLRCCIVLKLLLVVIFNYFEVSSVVGIILARVPDAVGLAYVEQARVI